MIKQFHLGSGGAIINLSINACATELKVLQSDGFSKVLNKYLRSITMKSSNKLFRIKKVKNAEQKIIEIYKLLLVVDYDDILKKNDHLKDILLNREDLRYFSEKLYDYWRKMERYGIIQKKIRSVISETNTLIDETEKFSKVILRLYRTINENIIGNAYHVYRQAPAGINAGLVVSQNKWQMPNEYKSLEGIDFIDTVIIRTPFMGYSKSNTRSGFFTEIKENPITDIKVTPSNWLCYPVKVGPLLAYVYFHRNFLHHGAALCNLFQPAFQEDYLGKKPDIMYVFGVKETENDCCFYYDKKNDIYIGIANREEKNDYFGYMKKMLLTLHNLHMINKNALPIHGAMVKITLKNNVEKNIVVIGDSGAGKSETLEALRVIGDSYIKEMEIIFDDMGTFFNDEKKIVAVGSEIGAFIRLDDLENGYAYREIDRAFFFNPDKINARVILPVSEYSFIIKRHSVDMVFYANNYEDTDEGIKFFNNVDNAIEVMREGARKAKGTTSEVGLVKSYFANPFGPVQKQEKTDVLLNEVFKKLFSTKIPVGEIYTRLAIDGYELKGPQIAAKKMLEMLLKK